MLKIVFLIKEPIKGDILGLIMVSPHRTPERWNDVTKVRCLAGARWLLTLVNHDLCAWQLGFDLLRRCMSLGDPKREAATASYGRVDSLLFP